MPRTAFRFIPPKTSSSVPHDDWYPPPGASADRTIIASFVISAEASPISVIMLRRGGDILTFSSLTWVVGHSVYAPGRITLRRLQGAIVMYLNFASIFAAGLWPDLGIEPRRLC